MSFIRVENDITDELIEILNNPSNYIITDSNVLGLLPQPSKTKSKMFVLDAGEHSKNMKSVEAIITHLYKLGYDRHTTIIAIGGGVVGDIAGFVAGIYMRGIKWKNIPTTLLSQVDSAVGGKTGIDYAGYKNLIGLFNQPEEIIMPLSFLSTLSEDNWISGLGEIIKTAFLDSSLYEAVQSDFEKIKKRDPVVMRNIIEKCIKIKKAITDSDLREAGPRKALNVGHTIGHALETLDKFSRSHGEYVLWGMKYENFINKERIEGSFYLKMQTLISRALLGKEPPAATPAPLAELCQMDKKNSDGLITMVIPENIGLIREVRFKPKQLAKELKKCLSDA